MNIIISIMKVSAGVSDAFDESKVKGGHLGQLCIVKT